MPLVEIALCLRMDRRARAREALRALNVAIAAQAKARDRREFVLRLEREERL